jgi:anti-anti-sigma factor
MMINIEQRGLQARLALAGRFDFACHRAFKDAYEKALRQPEAAEVVVEMGQVSYVDSSALGMLLILRDRAVEHGKSVTLAGAAGVVAEVLRVANFEKLFRLA